jgi:pimeloyl-ACP methyl ester carboxylesterase
MPTFDVGGVPIAYTDTGAPQDRPDAPTVVLGHGLLFGGWMFRAQVAALRDRYRCVTIDWRGQGDSPPAAARYDMDTLTADAVAVIRELDVGPVHWVGLSMGGFVGLRLGARHGDLLRSLTVLGSSADAEDAAQAREYRGLALAQAVVGIRPIAGRVVPYLFGPAFLAEPNGRAVVEEWISRLGRARRSAVRRAVLAVADRGPVLDVIDGIGVPTLVVVGADDKATPPEQASQIAGLVPGARLETVPDCGHTSTLERPEAISALLAAFLDADFVPVRVPAR